MVFSLQMTCSKNCEGSFLGDSVQPGVTWGSHSSWKNH